MSLANGSTTLVALFHDGSHARQVTRDLQAANVPEAATTVIHDAEHASLEQFDIPARDISHLKQGLASGGTLVVVQAPSHQVSIVERIFAEGSVAKIDEAVIRQAPAVAAIPADANIETGNAIPVVEEELQVGKRVVDRGGVRVSTHVAEVPVDASVVLHEEHAVVQRHAVDRPATDADLAQSGRSITLTETAEEAVIGKTAHVVEEIRLSKEKTEHTEQVHDTVRKTEVEVEQLAPDNTRLPQGKSL